MLHRVLDSQRYPRYDRDHDHNRTIAAVLHARRGLTDCSTVDCGPGRDSFASVASFASCAPGSSLGDCGFAVDLTPRLSRLLDSSC